MSASAATQNSVPFDRCDARSAQSGKVTSADGTRIAYTRVGEGPPLILVDGALCSRSIGPMPKLAEVVASSFAVFTDDRRGRGESGDVGPYAVEGRRAGAGRVSP